MSREFWTALRVRSLRNLWAGEHRAQVIADSIGDGCTRNMVIGKANRLGLPSRSKKQIAQALAEARQAFIQSPAGDRYRKWKSGDSKRLWATPSWRRKTLAGMREARA